ncbi:HPF/RaiA family ribosome-associated protein [Patescibacteria group bacterium]|nr:HPF/RaiA family ribosome-associated protein [Patescibacteria group bacterium]MBU1123828.1 HPF/RaiA family ribosome-associated protein [Patescibacteria group bacterium]MBU1911371.1 HPF/RaiA family ribosome-associated protein [Patescibacteria group bacterium]
MAKKIGKLATYCKKIKDESSSIRVESEMRRTKKGRDSMKVTMTVELPGKVLRSESRRPDPVEGVDRCCEKMEPQIIRYKEMRTGRGRVRR